MKFLLDVNVSKSIVPWLVRMGHDVALVTERDRRMRDEQILDWAVREQRVIITTDKDFEGMIWQEGRSHCGVLRLENVPRSTREALLLYVLNHHIQDLASGAIVIALRSKIRIRKPS